MTIKILNLELTNQIKELFDDQIVHPVELIYFFDEETCETCGETSQLLDEIASLSTKLQLSKYEINTDQLIAKKYNVNLTPGLVIAGTERGEPIDYGIRFAGIPSGYEFGSLIQSILLVSKGDSGLKPEVRKQIKELKKPVQLRVFVTPT